ncbi:MAG: hypothetical protein IKA00_11645 [Prevotella sp.]|nr:hypothetical protein [Prevotella sp.]
MKVLRFIALYILIIVAFPAFAQLGIPAGWKIDAAVEAAYNQDIDITANDIDMTKGSMHRKMKAMINASRTFVIDRHLSMGLSAGYRFYDFDFDFDNASAIDMGGKYHTLRLGGNALYNTMLWNRPLVIMGNMSIEGGKWGLERISGIGVAMLMLKATREEMLGVGLIGLINSTSDFPIFPMAIYRKVYSPQWILNLNHPFFSLQYVHDDKQTLMAGFAFENERFWLKPSLEGLPEVTLFNRSVVRTGLNYDLKLSKECSLTAQTGWEYTMRARMFHRNGHHERLDFGHPNGLYARMAVNCRIR